MMNVHKMAVAVLLTMVAVTFSACGSSYSTPEDLGKAYATAMKDFDKDAMVALFIESEREEMMKGLVEMESAMKGKEKSEEDNIAFDSASEESVGGKSYRVVKVTIGSMSVNGGEKQPMTMDMVAIEADGGWLFSNAEQKAYREAKRAAQKAKKDQ